MLGPEFSYYFRFGRILGYMAITMFYSYGVPLLPVILFVYLFTNYHFDKCLLLKFYKRITNLEPNIAKYLFHSMAALLFIHIWAAAFMLGSEDIFPSKTETK